MPRVTEVQVRESVLFANEIEELSNPGKLYPLYIEFLKQYSAPTLAWGYLAQHLIKERWQKKTPSQRTDEAVRVLVAGSTAIIQEHLREDSLDDNSFAGLEKTYTFNDEQWNAQGICPAPQIARKWFETANAVITRARNEGKLK
jgi:hypothetical protein